MSDDAGRLERGVRWFDDRQQERTWLAFPLGVVRKYGDDRGSALAALVTFHMFLGLLPLLVLLLTVFGRYLEDADDVRDSALDSALGQLPIVGPAIADDVSGLVASGPVVALSIVGLLWTATGIYTSLQLAMNQVWNVEGQHRQGFVSRHVRALLLFGLILIAAVGTEPFQGQRPFGLSGAALAGLHLVLAVAMAIGVLLLVLRLVVAPVIPVTRLIPAAVMAGLLWTLLQQLGGALVSDRLSEAGDLYGSIAIVVVTLFWINLLARSVVLANEWAVVSWRGLWPRRLTQPPLNEADRRVLTALVNNERRRPEQHIEVTFDDDADESPSR